MLDLPRGPLRLAMSIDAEDREAIFSVFSRTIVVGRKAMLRQQGDRSDLVRILQSGMALRQKTAADGSRQIVGLLMAGHLCDVSSLFFEEPDHAIETVTDCAVAVARRNDVLDLMNRRPTVTRAILARCLADAAIAREWVVNVGRRTAHQRVAHILCEIFVCNRRMDFADESTCTLPLTQEQLADAAGLSIVQVNRTLQDLRRRDVITLRHKILVVHDWQMLCSEGDFSPSYLH
ncbi:MAG TPA: Crp/Fnr family transcriptional regulator [Aurantimonas sp.]|jgi:CRP-like cAMP-binding protein|nr:Crp/Fnr family transcriptional regulator [Aurantimonas sp.]